MSSLRVKCPTCKREADWDGNGSRPFCSERCRLADLGAWLTEQRGIPAEANSDLMPPSAAETQDTDGEL